jgi:hypothetical protein
MTDTLPFGSLNSAKSFVEFSNFVEFSSKNLLNAGDNKMISKKIEILLEVNLIQQSINTPRFKREFQYHSLREILFPMRLLETRG